VFLFYTLIFLGFFIPTHFFLDIQQFLPAKAASFFSSMAKVIRVNPWFLICWLAIWFIGYFVFLFVLKILDLSREKDNSFQEHIKKLTSGKRDSDLDAVANIIVFILLISSFFLRTASSQLVFVSIVYILALVGVRKKQPDTKGSQ